MQHKPATYALLRLHAELNRKFQDIRQQRPSLSLDLWHVEAVIQLLEPGFRMRPLGKRKSNSWFKHGTLFRHATEALKAADRPLTTREVALEILARHWITDADPADFRAFLDSLDSVLRFHKGRDVVAAGGNSSVHWKLAD